MRARPAFSMVSYIFAYCAIIGAFSISGYVTCGATVIANHHGVDARCRTVRINWYEGLDGWFQKKVFKQIGVGVAKLATENRRCSVVLESLSHNGKPPLPGFELGRPRPPFLVDFQSEQPGDALRPDAPRRIRSVPSNLEGILKGIRGIRIKNGIRIEMFCFIMGRIGISKKIRGPVIYRSNDKAINRSAKRATRAALRQPLRPGGVHSVQPGATRLARNLQVRTLAIQMSTASSSCFLATSARTVIFSTRHTQRIIPRTKA
jgi:hypothetical protein